MLDMAGLFGSFFDFNRDGEMSTLERVAEFQFLNSMIHEDEKVDMDANEDEKLELLEEAGLDVDELEYMDDDERREVLEEAGIDPDDFDF